MFGALHSPSVVPEGALLELAHVFAPRAEGGRDLVLLDLQGLGRLWASPHDVADALRQAALERGLPPLTIVVAATRSCAAHLARARAPGVHVVAAGLEAKALASLPLALLDLPEEAAQTLARWGVRLLGELAALPSAGLVARLGPPALRWQRAARGEDERPLVPTRPSVPFDVHLDLDWPIEGLEPLAFVLGPVLERLAALLEAHGCRAVSLTLDLGLADRHVATRVVRTAAPTLSPRTWRTLLLLDLEANPPADAVVAITVRAAPVSARGTQFSLFEIAVPSPERLSETMARLSEWTKNGRAGSPALVPTHRPGAFVMTGFVPSEAPAPTPLAVPRLRIALRAYRPPRPVRVELHDGVPAAVRGAGLDAVVVSRAGPWRASGDWWDVVWSRDEWDVELRSAGLYRIFHDRLRRGWFVEGELD
jgi:protein ImuB